jgi:hypothetical protein
LAVGSSSQAAQQPQKAPPPRKTSRLVVVVIVHVFALQQLPISSSPSSISLPFRLCEILWLIERNKRETKDERRRNQERERTYGINGNGNETLWTRRHERGPLAAGKRGGRGCSFSFVRPEPPPTRSIAHPPWNVAVVVVVVVCTKVNLLLLLVRGGHCWLSISSRLLLLRRLGRRHFCCLCPPGAVFHFFFFFLFY